MNRLMSVRMRMRTSLALAAIFAGAAGAWWPADGGTMSAAPMAQSDGCSQSDITTCDCATSPCHLVSVSPPVPWDCNPSAGYRVVGGGTTCTRQDSVEIRVHCTGSGLDYNAFVDVDDETFSFDASCLCAGSTVGQVQAVGTDINLLFATVQCCDCDPPPPTATSTPTDVPTSMPEPTLTPTEMPTPTYTPTVAPTMTQTPAPTPTADFGVKSVRAGLDPDFLTWPPHPFINPCPPSGPVGPEHDGAVSARYRNKLNAAGEHGWEVTYTVTYRNDRTGQTNVHTCQLNPVTGQFMNCGNLLGHPVNSGLISMNGSSLDNVNTCPLGPQMHSHYAMDLQYVRAYTQGGDTWRLVPLTGSPDFAGFDVAYTVMVQNSLTNALGPMRKADECQTQLVACQPTVQWRFPQPGDTSNSMWCLIWMRLPAQ